MSLDGSGLVVNWSEYLTVGLAVHPGQERVRVSKGRA